MVGASWVLGTWGLSPGPALAAEGLLKHAQSVGRGWGPRGVPRNTGVLGSLSSHPPS